MSEPTVSLEVDVHKKLIQVGEDEDGPRYLLVFALLGDLYIVWRIHGQYRWARNVRDKPELRLGIAGHGAADDLQAAVLACLANFADSEKIRVEAGGEPLAPEGVRPKPTGTRPEAPSPPLDLGYCRECDWEGQVPPNRMCPACRSPRVSRGLRNSQEDGS